MTNKQIIIDGVDVSGCNFTLERDGKIKCECCHATGFGVICDCESWKTCDYKNYKAKEQECERLKEENKEIRKYQYEQDFLQQQLDQLKANYKELKKVNIHIENNRIVKAKKLKRIEDLIIACNSGYTDEFIQELLVILHEPEPSSFENKYKTILVEIKGIAEENDDLLQGYHKEWANNKLILQKISEVE